MAKQKETNQEDVVAVSQAAMRKAYREELLENLTDGRIQRAQVIPDKKKTQDKSKARGREARNRAMSERLYY